MALIQGVNGIHINQYSGVNSGSRILSCGTTIPNNELWTTVIAFTLNSGASSNFGLSFRYYFGAERASGTIAENQWGSMAGIWNSAGTSWTEVWYAVPWYSGDGNGIVNYRVAISGTSLSIQSVTGTVTNCYVGGYCEVECGKWDQVTISY